MEKDVVVIGSGTRAVGLVGTLGLVGKPTVCHDGNWVKVESFSGHPTDIPDTRRISGVAKDRRLARKKRAKKVARRR